MRRIYVFLDHKALLDGDSLKFITGHLGQYSQISIEILLEIVPERAYLFLYNKKRLSKYFKSFNSYKRKPIRIDIFLSHYNTTSYFTIINSFFETLRNLLNQYIPEFWCNNGFIIFETPFGLYKFNKDQEFECPITNSFIKKYKKLVKPLGILKDMLQLIGEKSENKKITILSSVLYTEEILETDTKFLPLLSEVSWRVVNIF